MQIECLASTAAMFLNPERTRNSCTAARLLKKNPVGERHLKRGLDIKPVGISSVVQSGGKTKFLHDLLARLTPCAAFPKSLLSNRCRFLLPAFNFGIAWLLSHRKAFLNFLRLAVLNIRIGDGVLWGVSWGINSINRCPWWKWGELWPVTGNCYWCKYSSVLEFMSYNQFLLG